MAVLTLLRKSLKSYPKQNIIFLVKTSVKEQGTCWPCGKFLIFHRNISFSIFFSLLDDLKTTMN